MGWAEVEGAEGHTSIGVDGQSLRGAEVERGLV